MEPERQSEAVKRLLLRGLRLSKWEIREALRIENVGRCIAELRAAGLPIATIWYGTLTGQPLGGADGRPLAWTGERFLGHALTKQPPNSYAVYQLCCRDCGTVKLDELGWRPLANDAGYDLGEYAETYQCIKCLAEAMCST